MLTSIPVGAKREVPWHSGERGADFFERRVFAGRVKVLFHGKDRLNVARTPFNSAATRLTQILFVSDLGCRYNCRLVIRGWQVIETPLISIPTLPNVA
jgi:hypothetical protein